MRSIGNVLSLDINLSSSVHCAIVSTYKGWGGKKLLVKLHKMVLAETKGKTRSQYPQPPPLREIN